MAPQLKSPSAARPGPGLAGRLLDWYDRHRRVLAWRAPAGVRPDPYHVWLSEIMLQQTTVAAVERYFLDFTRTWPTVEALAAASLDDVLRRWAGLGYYARARNLHACARAVAAGHAGRFPDREEALLALPGIGPYTAAAIAAIAFDRPAAAVDGNVERVMSRLHAIVTPLPAAKPEIRARTLELVPAARAGDFAQALMDLGAGVCTPRRPACRACPWHDACRARAEGMAETLPRKVPPPERPVRRAAVFWAETAAGAVLMRRRPERGLLGGMLEFPSTPWQAEMPADIAAHAPYAAAWARAGGRVEHTFTHFHLVLDLWAAPAVFERLPDRQPGDWRWVAPEALAGEALPSVMRKVAAAMRDDLLVRRRAG